MSAARRICLELLARMPHGQLTVLEGDEAVTVGDGEPHATVRIRTAFHNPARDGPGESHQEPPDFRFQAHEATGHATEVLRTRYGTVAR